MKENFKEGEQYQNQRACMQLMLDMGVLPIVNENDTVALTELMFTDNDELSGLIAMMLDADRLILLSNIDGIYDGDPKLPSSQVITIVTQDMDLSRYRHREKSSFGRGGMESKYHTATEVASHGINVIIANGTRENILVDLISDSQNIPHTEFMV